MFNSTRRRFLLLLLGLTLPVAACGRKGKPVPPPESKYPRKYPAE